MPEQLQADRTFRRQGGEHVGGGEVALVERIAHEHAQLEVVAQPETRIEVERIDGAPRHLLETGPLHPRAMRITYGEGVPDALVARFERQIRRADTVER